jgi:hypothetical protein
LAVLRELDIDVTVLNGPRLDADEDYSGQTGYRINAAAFCEFLDNQLGDQAQIERSTPRPRMRNIFTYWDKPDLTPIAPTLEDWRSHFPDFSVLGDQDVEPILEELAPQHLEMFRRIRMPSAKSDVALLLALYKFGGLHIDCHCGIRDADAIRQLLISLDQWEWEVILYDKRRDLAPRPASEINCLNSVLFARQNSSIVLETLKTVLTHLADHWAIEKQHGFQAYHVAQLTLPGSLGETLLVDPEAPISRLRTEYLNRVRFIQEGPEEPIGRYMHYGYRVPGMHWSERQTQELLFS